MEWMVINPLQVHGTLASVGVQIGNSYHVSKDCLSVLHEILSKLSLEHRHLRTFRRALGFTQVIQKDLLPLLINVKDDFKIIDTTIRILVNLTIPVECLLPLDEVCRTDVGRHTTYELNKLLISGKEAFLDAHSTRAVLNHMKHILEKSEKLSEEECECINNCLLLLRNVLHIPEVKNNQHSCSLQNQILWNLFTQSIDKILIHLMTCEQKGYWGVTMVQLIAIMYKDQHVGTLQKLLNQWFEASLSESSEDNESNTSPPDQGSGGESSPVLTSDPTSDSSDNGYNQQDTRMQCHNIKNDMDLKSSEPDRAAIIYHSKLTSFSEQCSKNSNENARKAQMNSCIPRKNCSNKGKRERTGDSDIISTSPINGSSPSSVFHSRQSPLASKLEVSNNMKCPSSSELSDYGYATQVENQESISTSSNEDEFLQSKRPVHQKPHTIQKTRLGNKHNTAVQDKKELRRKKLVKRSRTNIMNMKALVHHVPSDEDISNILKEFTVDFLLKGYGNLVQELHSQLLHGKESILVDTSHFFWLVTYFLKFAAQLELDLEHVSSVLSFDIISYLTYEGVNLCEQLQLASRHPGNDLKPCLRRMHLVVTAIREFIQAMDTYRKLLHLSKDHDHLVQLQIQIASTEDLKYLFVLLIHNFNPNIQSKQYLQDLIVTNHILLIFLDNVGKLPEYKRNMNIVEHIKQFATLEIMHQYGLLLEEFQNNGEFINDCIFTMMHHIGGDLEKVSALFQPNILKAFSKIWETDYEVCDDWSDLIEYVIHKFIDKPRQFTPAPNAPPLPTPKLQELNSVGQDPPALGWPKEERDSLCWFYMQNAKCPDPVGRVKDLLSDNGITNKSKIDIIQQLFFQDIINQEKCEELIKKEKDRNEENCEIRNIGFNFKQSPMMYTNSDNAETYHIEREMCNETGDEIRPLREQMIKDGKISLLTWLQKSLLEACYVKLNADQLHTSPKNMIMEPIPHYYTLMNQSIPVVPWNTEQRNSLSYQPFVLLLHKMGFHLPADSGKVFVRIPNFWTPDVLFTIAQKLGPINHASLKFDVNLVKMNYTSANQDISSLMTSQNQVNQFAVQPVTLSSPFIRSSPLPNSSSNWLQIVMQSKLTSLPPRPITPPKDRVPPQQSASEKVPELIRSEHGSDCSICETVEGSVTSDLTRMCVSDEEERHEQQEFSDSTIT